MGIAPSPEPFDWSDLPGATTIQPDARVTWPSEVMDMTPWVIEHLDLVGEAVGLDLNVATVRREVRLGAFRADITLLDRDGRTVMIENQFGPSDHDHFAKIVMYGCEASAEVVVWIVAGTGSRSRIWTPIRPEHQRMLARLNQVFEHEIEFYGLSIEFESEPQRSPVDEQSPVLPRLKKVVGPNNHPNGSSVRPSNATDLRGPRSGNAAITSADLDDDQRATALVVPRSWVDSSSVCDGPPRLESSKNE
jgi:hypothetical protein